MTYSFSYLETVCCSMSSSNCCFLNCIQISKHRWRWQAGGLSAAESYPAPEVRDNSPECQVATAQERLGGATPCPRSGAAAERSYPASEASGCRKETPRDQGQGGGREETAHVRGQGQLGEATSHPRPGIVTLRSHPEPEARARGQEEQPEEQWRSRHRGPRGAIPR